MGICSVLLYGVVESPYLFSKTGIKNPAERFMADFLSFALVYFPIVLILFSLSNFTLNLILSSKHLAEWMYPYQRAVDRVTFRFQVDRWYRREKSSSLGLDLGAGSDSLDEGNHERSIYAPPQTILPGESLAERPPAARQQAITHTPLFVRCQCCLDNQSTIDLGDTIQRNREADRISFWSKGKRRAKQAFSDFQEQRKTLLCSPPGSFVRKAWTKEQDLLIKNHELVYRAV